MFIPGETIAQEFTMPFVREGITRVFVTYKQNNRVILRKTVLLGNITNDSGRKNCYFTVVLSQQESLLFKNDSDYTIQLNVLFNTGARCVSKEMNGTNGVQHIRKVVTTNG